MAEIKVNESLKYNLNAIKSFTDEQLKFYRDNESYKYDELLEIINFIKQNDFDTLNHIFYLSKNYIKDFKELFESFINYEEYNRTSSKKSNFHKTIEKLTRIIQKHNTKEKEEKQAFSEILNKYETKFKKIEETLNNYQETSNLLHKDFKEKNNQIDTIAKKAQNIETAFSEHHKIFETKKYWQEKATKHLWSSGISFFIFLVLISAMISFISNQIDTSKQNDIQKSPISVLVEKNTTTLTKSPQLIEYQKTMEKHMIIRTFQYLFLFSLILWISRILLKITFSHLHLSEEAQEKETMIMTYLALINDGGGLKDNDRQLILEAIFRPSTNGLIKDETNVTLLDIVKGLKK